MIWLFWLGWEGEAFNIFDAIPRFGWFADAVTVTVHAGLKNTGCYFVLELSAPSIRSQYQELEITNQWTCDKGG